MLSRIRPRLTYANVVASIALFVVLGGGAYATIDRKIGPKDIRKNAVTTPKIKGQAVKTPKIANKAVTAAKLADGVAISGPQGPAGPQGPQGEQGSAGPQGPAGTALAYAQKGAGVGFVSQRTSGFVGITRPSTGLYCLERSAAVVNQAFSGGSPTRPPVASVEWGNTTTQTNELIVQPRGATVNCPNNTYEVRTYRNGALDNNVAFILIVP